MKSDSENMAMRFLRNLLLPFVPAYAGIVKLRNFLFDAGIFKSGRANSAIVSVGNLAVGGTGKTPLVIYVINLLKQKGLNAGALSRGYGRKTKGYLLVSDGKEIKTNVENCGDEMYQTVMECSIPAAVSENRVKGANRLVKECGVKVIVLDDAFQHRWIHRDVNLLIMEQKFLLNETYLNSLLLPTGNLREGFSSVKRADAVIINRKFSGKEELPEKYARYFTGKPIFYAKYKSIEFIDVKTHSSYPIKEFEGQKSLVVCGVANPFSFLNALKQSNISTLHNLIFKDHKDYTEKEVQKIRKEFYNINAHSVVTTHKDAVKLAQYSRQLDDIDIYYLRIEMEFDNKEEFDGFVIKKINNCS